MKIKYLFIFLCLSISGFSDYMNDINIIPIITHSLGEKGTFWKTDCFIMNNSSEYIKVRLNFYPMDSYEEKTYDISLEGYKQIKLEDIVLKIFGMEGSGYFIIDASNYTFPSNPEDVPMATQCRIYNTKEDSSTYGQSIPDQFFEALWPYVKEGILIGVINNERFRTNVGLACQFWGSDIILTYYNENSEEIGKETIFIDSKEVKQFRFPYELDSGWVKVEMVEDDFCYAYISVIDNLSGDASFFSPFFILSYEKEDKINFFKQSINKKTKGNKENR